MGLAVMWSLIYGIAGFFVGAYAGGFGFFGPVGIFLGPYLFLGLKKVKRLERRVPLIMLVVWAVMVLIIWIQGVR
jgi:hypothetical protein